MKIQNRSGSKLWTLSDFAILSAMGQQCWVRGLSCYESCHSFEIFQHVLEVRIVADTLGALVQSVKQHEVIQKEKNKYCILTCIYGI